MKDLGAIVLVAAVSSAFMCGPGGSTTPPAGDTPLVIEVGRNPVEIAAGDLDGDGVLDLVSANGSDNSLSVRLRRASGWVAPSGAPLSLDVGPHIVTPVDVDGDRDLDLVATAHDGGGVYVWMNDGKAGFAPAAGSPFVGFAAGRPHNHGLGVGDLDGDGDADVVMTDQDARGAAVLLGDGRGGFAPAAGTPVALGAQPYAIALGEMNGDGRLDLVVPLISTRDVAVLLGDGKGGFAHAPGSPHRTAFDRPYAIALADLDRDGVHDVVAPHDDTDRVSVLLNDGKGGLRDAPGAPIDLGRRIWKPALADLDGDGDIDLVGAGSGDLIVADGDGKGGFAAPRVIGTRAGWMAIVADLDGDGRADVASPDPGANAIRVWLTP